MLQFGDFILRLMDCGCQCACFVGKNEAKRSMGNDTKTTSDQGKNGRKPDEFTRTMRGRSRLHAQELQIPCAITAELRIVIQGRLGWGALNPPRQEVHGHFGTPQQLVEVRLQQVS